MSAYCQEPRDHRNTGWYVEQYMYHRSAFQGGRVTPSPRSLVRCVLCGGVWRTSAQYTHTLPRTAPVGVSADRR